LVRSLTLFIGRLSSPAVHLAKCALVGEELFPGTSI
jgi:predicted small integral membrane protein